MTIQERINKGVCCFCEGELGQTGGNNPDPACTIKDARCCDYCDETIVLPARISIDQLIKKAVAEKNAPDELPPFDLDEDPEADDAFTVGMVNDFREKFSQQDNNTRNLILHGLFQIDQQGRQNEFDNAELRKVSVKQLYSLLNDAHQEQIRRYIELLLVIQKCGGI